MDTNETNATRLPGPLRFSPLRIELAKMLKLVAPISMSAEAQAVWINAAIDALEGIQSAEIQAISAELRRTVTRPAQIVPEIARLVADLRRRLRAGPAVEGSGAWQIERDCHDRRMRAVTRPEIESAWKHERDEMIKLGRSVKPILPILPPMTRAQLDKLSPSMVALGLKSGLLVREGGQLREIVLP